MRPYTKKQIEAMRSAIIGAWLSLRDMGMPAEVFSRALAEKRSSVVLGGLRERIAWHQSHVAESRGTAQHFRAHPEVYGQSTPEMIERFEVAAAKYDKGAAWFRVLEQRVESDGLPPEVIVYDPTVTK